MSSKCSVYIVIYVLWVEIWSTECMQYESAENKWANVGEQQSMIKIVRLFVKFSELRENFNNWSIVFFFGLRNFLIYCDLEKFHALQNLENKWKLWTLKKFKEALDLENFWVGQT